MLNIDAKRETIEQRGTVDIVNNTENMIYGSCKWVFRIFSDFGKNCKINFLPVNNHFDRI